MKIFDWMHRKLQKAKVHYKKGAEDFEEIGDHETSKQVEMDNEALLLQLDSTILSIGTLGYCNDHLYNFEEEEEELPEVINSVSLPVKGKSTSITTSDQNNKILKNDKLKLSLNTMAEEKVMPVEEEENSSEPLLDKKSEERKSLLDLFKESDDTEKKAGALGIPNACGRENEITLALIKKSTCYKNCKGSNPKKLLSWKKGENSTNPKTLSRLITKMMRKKIYPEVNEVMMTEKRGPKQQYKDKKESTDESNSLLLRPNVANRISLVAASSDNVAGGRIKCVESEDVLLLNVVDV